MSKRAFTQAQVRKILHDYKGTDWHTLKGLVSDYINLCEITQNPAEKRAWLSEQLRAFLVANEKHR